MLPPADTKGEQKGERHKNLKSCASARSYYHYYTDFAAGIIIIIIKYNYSC